MPYLINQTTCIAMFYRGFKILMKLVLRVFFRKVYLSGASQIPADQPVILACNHPNSFLDAVLLAVLLPRPLHFLARSDVFDTPVKRWLLCRLHLMPIYRLEEGTEHLHRNEETFARCYQILKNKGAVLIFSEGVCVLEKRLRPLRKGTARLAFATEASHQFNLHLQVVPVGINYTYPNRFRQEVMIGVGAPITVGPWQHLYLTHPGKAIREFNHLLRQELEQHIISIPFQEQEAPAEAAFRQSRAASTDFFSPAWFSASRSRLSAEQEIARQVALGAVPGPGMAEASSGEPGPPKKPFWPSRPTLLLSLAVALPGLALNGLPLALAWLITRKKVTKREFYASVLMAVGLLLYLIYWLSVTAGAALVWGWKGIALSLLIPLSAYPALFWTDQYRLWKLASAVSHDLMRYPVKA
jgi:1-acyl-sn-glycerol-3-phosphate acyltransferase